MFKDEVIGDNKKILQEDPDLFFDMEKKYNLFSLKTYDDIPLWDIFRPELYNYIIYKDEIKGKASVSYGKAQMLFVLIKKFAGLYKIINRKKYFFFGVSRFVNKKGEYFDPYLETIKPLIGNDFLLYETAQNKPKYKEKGVADVSTYLLRIFRPIYYNRVQKSVDKDLLGQIISVLQDTYGYEVVTEEILRNIFFKFKVHYLFYKLIFSVNRFKCVFLHQNGYQKGLIYAAHKSGIPVYEFQHADVIEFNIVWHYGTIPNYEDIIFPNVFLTYSNFWSDHNNIPGKSVEIGTAIHNIENFEVISNTVAIISTKEHEIELNELTLRLASIYPDTVFEYKLHPAQFNSIDEYKILFSKYSNIRVVPVDKTITDLIAEVQHFIVIYSSVIFELLQAKKQVYLYKRENFWFFRKFFNLPNVSLFDSAEEFYFQYKNASFSSSAPVPEFYVPLRLDKLKSLLDVEVKNNINN
ncbi:hypothetical protein [Flavobacterium notoginsengisoli]|uniref:hypothetical protein n=1 Tax=Flavobacterium notoginsengisoli TaxID=1478199 RepID=UPI0036351DB4